VGAPATIWLGEPLREAVEAVETAVRGEGGLIVVTGDVGVGKTTLARALVERLGDGVIVASLLYPHIRATELRAVLRDAWAPGADVETREAFLHAIDTALDAADAGKQSLLLLVDEAQGLTPEALDEIAALLQHAAARPQLSVLLIGQDELKSVLAASPLHGRIRLLQRIRTLQEREIQEYVTARRGVSLSATESRDIARASRGVPRLIERLCDNREAARLAAAATMPADVDEDEPTDGRSQPAARSRRVWWLVAAGGALAVAGLAAWWVTGPGQREASAPAPVSVPAPAPDVAQPAAPAAEPAAPDVAPPAPVGAVAGPGATEAASPPPTAPRVETPPATPPVTPRAEKTPAPTPPRVETPPSPSPPRVEKPPAAPAEKPVVSTPTPPRPETPPRATTQPRAVETPRVAPEPKRVEPVRPRPVPEARTETAPTAPRPAPPAIVAPAPRPESQRARPAPEPRRDDAAQRDRAGDDDPGAVIDWLLRERR
jgi:general secretion pathway protein A